jgi:hypothetical protein
VAEGPAHRDCRNPSTTRLRGYSAHGRVDVVFGKGVHVHVADAEIRPESKRGIPAIHPLARMGCHAYTAVSETFAMPIPGAPDAAAAGLEGKT